MPGMTPSSDISLKQFLEILNLREYPLLLPVNSQRLRIRTWDVSRGILLSLRRASSRSSSGKLISLAFSLSSCRLSKARFTFSSRRLFLAIADFLAMVLLFKIISFRSFSSRPFLSLLSIGIFFVDHIKTAATSYQNVSLRWICFDRCF